MRPQDDTTFEVSLSSGETLFYDAVLVANGHHWDPRMPEPMFPGADGFVALSRDATDEYGHSGMNREAVFARP
ncbi:hypothetical protein [Streptomyces sp. NPDC001450]